jgi:two-component system, NtrC family, response regulator GlrR
MSTRTELCVCGLGDDPDFEWLVQTVTRAASSMQVCAIRWPDHQSLLAGASESAAAYVLLSSSSTPPSEMLALQRALAAVRDAHRDDSDSVPLIVIGEDPATAARPSCSLRDLRDPAAMSMLTALVAGIRQNIVASASDRPPPSMSWRRKTDMIIGNSPAIEQLLRALDRIASSTGSVLVSGESGTGKELVARALHFSGPRAREPFMAINCAAIPETLFEAELFGYQRGAFTGATTSRAGAFESADKGTLFLDEIGELPLSLQVKLLRVLETGQVTRLGSNESRSVSVRVVSATNRELEEEIANGRFREDLYYRLRVFPVHVPPLRSRAEDITPIAHHHLALIAAREKRPVPRLTPAALEKLICHPWQGNVRELINTLERAFILGNPIDEHHLELTGGRPAAKPSLTSYRTAKQLFEEDYFDQLMRVTAGNVTFAAKVSKKTRKEIYDALKRVGLDPTRYRAADAPPESEADISPPTSTSAEAPMSE